MGDLKNYGERRPGFGCQVGVVMITILVVSFRFFMELHDGLQKAKLLASVVFRRKPE